MKRKIKIITLICSVLILGACESWLDVKPYDKIAEEDLFSTQAGFETLLNGIYIELNDANLYGGALTVEMIELMGGAYSIGNEQIKWGDYIDLKEYQYNSVYWRGRFDKVWEKSYALIMNCNKILDNMERDKSIFSGVNYNIIKGEALAIRAMLHFDMLRLFGPVYKNNSENISIPYYKHQGEEVNDLLPANTVIEYVINDLKESEKLLQDDPIITDGVLMDSSPSGGSNFLRYRPLRLNYYATQGLLARVYLYAGDKTNASIYAKKVIEVAEKGDFPFISRSEAKNDRVFSSEILFGLTNTNRILLFKNYHDPSRNPAFVFTMDNRMLDFLFSPTAFSTQSDVRFEAHWQQVTLPGVSVGSKYFYKYDDMSPSNLIQNTLVPMIRLGEMYLIAAESESDDLNSGLKYINELRKQRGVSDLTTLDLMSLTYEYIRELYGEGQLFYLYKRTFSTIFNRRNNRGTALLGESPSDKVFVVPLPDTEVNNR